MGDGTVGLRCPLCGSCYLGVTPAAYRAEIDEKEVIVQDDVLALNLTVGAVCHNQSHFPRNCTPASPCPGILEPFDD